MGGLDSFCQLKNDNNNDLNTTITTTTISSNIVEEDPSIEALHRLKSTFRTIIVS